MILSAFEATGIQPFDPYRSNVMHEWREKARFEHLGPNAENAPPRSPRHRRIAIMEQCRELANDSSASSDLLCKGLLEALQVIDGAEARAVILDSDLQQLRNALEEKQTRKPRGGRVERVRVYRQKEVDDVFAQEQGCIRGATA